ncbi:hypothetical protein [Sporolactobacillus vineae]|uniref:hypothetical protein n=1 Tax=Sporolactobacillus vineae TaxID=444463 RepID=UPI0002881462|nr:hypothetical protein [Sporolactobacillus vineae]
MPDGRIVAHVHGACVERFFAGLVPLTLAIMIHMFSTKLFPSENGGLEGGEVAAFIGSDAALACIPTRLMGVLKTSLPKIVD